MEWILHYGASTRAQLLVDCTLPEHCPSELCSMTSHGRMAEVVRA